MLKSVVYCEGFIGNGRAVHTVNNFRSSQAKDQAISVCRVNNIKPYYTRMVNINIGYDDIDITNHGCIITANDMKQYKLFGADIPNYFPASLFKDKNENDIVYVKVLCYASNVDQKEKDWNNTNDEIEVTFAIRLKQKKYKFHHMGSFSEAFEKVCW